MILSKRDYLRQCPRIKTVIHWYDLPENKILKLDSRFQKNKLCKKFLNQKYGSKKSVAKRLGITGTHLRLLSKAYCNFSVGSLRKIAREFGISFKEIENNIIAFGRKHVIKNPNFPFNMSSEEGVALRSIINSDGHISKQIGRSVMIRVPELDMLRNAIHFSKILFGEFDVKIKKTKDKNTFEIFLPGEIGDILVISGLTRGRKSTYNPYVPRDVIYGNLNRKKVYLQWSLAGEMECTVDSKILKLTRYVNVSNILPNNYVKTLRQGVIYKREIPRYILIKLSQCPPNLLIGEALLFADFEIFRDPYVVGLWKYKNGEVSAFWSLPITNKKEILIVSKKIGIPIKEKQRKVDSVLLTYKRP